MSPIDQVTFEKLKHDVGSDFIGELIAAYCDETPQLLAQLRLALRENDAAALRQAAHSIKSTSNTLGALSLGELAKDLEMMGRAGDLTGAQGRVDRLADEHERVQLALKDLEHD